MLRVIDLVKMYDVPWDKHEWFTPGLKLIDCLQTAKFKASKDNQNFIELKPQQMLLDYQ